MSATPPARIHLLAARAAPRVVVLRRGPSKRVHVMRWNTQTDEIEHGSWFQGRIYEMRCDVSFDGKWMVYLAMGAQGETWAGVCKPPFLRTAVHWENVGTWHGGGFFDESCLWVNAGYAEGKLREALAGIENPFPFQIEAAPHSPYGEDEGVLYPRLQRDGWNLDREPASTWGEGWGLKPIDECPQWSIRPTPDHPELLLWQRGYVFSHGRVFQFSMPDHLGLMDQNVTWATYDTLGQLLIARGGVLERYGVEDIGRGVPSFRFDANALTPPERREPPREPNERFRIDVFQGTALEVEAAALGLLHPSEEADRIISQAGAGAQKEFARRSRAGLVPNRVLATPPHGLRFKALLHVRPTTPRRAVRLILDSAQRHGLFSLVFGSTLTKGHEAACAETVLRWLGAQEPHARGRMVFVADDEAQANALRDALGTSQ